MKPMKMQQNRYVACFSLVQQKILSKCRSKFSFTKIEREVCSAD